MLGQRHISKDRDIEEIRKLENKADELRNIYVRILQDDIEELKDIKLGDFDNPNWMYERAYKDGMVSAYKKMLEIIGD